MRRPAIALNAIDNGDKNGKEGGSPLLRALPGSAQQIPDDVDRSIRPITVNRMAGAEAQ